jgi:hypothetical protein
MRPKVLSRVPSAVLSSRRPPFLNRVPVSPVPRRRQYYEGATTSHARLPGHLFVSLPGSTRFPLALCSLLPALPSGWRLRFGPGSLFSRRSFAGWLSRGREWDLSEVSRRPLLCLCPVPRPRPDRRSLATSGRVRCYPCLRDSKGSSVTSISRLPRGFSTCCLRFTSGVATATCKTRFRLAGWPLPGGRRTLWIAMRGFQVLHLFPLS